MTEGAVTDHEGRSLVREVDFRRVAEAAAEEGRDGGDVTDVGFGDDAGAAGTVVEDEIGDGAQQGAADAAAPVGDASDQQMDTGVVGRAG